MQHLTMSHISLNQDILKGGGEFRPNYVSEKFITTIRSGENLVSI